MYCRGHEDQVVVLLNGIGRRWCLRVRGMFCEGERHSWLSCRGVLAVCGVACVQSTAIRSGMFSWLLYVLLLGWVDVDLFPSCS